MIIMFLLVFQSLEFAKMFDFYFTINKCVVCHCATVSSDNFSAALQAVLWMSACVMTNAENERSLLLSEPMFNQTS